MMKCSCFQDALCTLRVIPELYKLMHTAGMPCRERILEYRDESLALEQNDRLYNSSAIKKEFEEEASSIKQVSSQLLALMEVI